MIEEEKARLKWCAFTAERNKFCQGNDCMAWQVLHPRVEREDHSGANQMMLQEAVKTQRTLKREGPPGSMGYLILEEVGVCGRLKSCS